MDENGAVHMQYEDGSPLVNQVTKSVYGPVTDILPSAIMDAPPHAVDVSIYRVNRDKRFASTDNRIRHSTHNSGDFWKSISGQ